MDKSQRKVGVVLSYITLLFQLVLGFVYVPLFIHFLGEDEYGLYQLIGSFTAYLSIMDFGLSATIIRYYSKYKAENNRENMENVLSLSTMIYSVITVLIIIAGVILYHIFDPVLSGDMSQEMIVRARQILIVVIFNMAITIPTKIFNAVIISYEKFIFLRLITLIQIVTQPVFLILVLSHMPTAMGIVAVQTGLNIAIILAQIYYCLRKLNMKIRFHHFDSGLFRSMLQFSMYTFIGALMDQVFWQSNKVIMNVAVSTAAVGMYGAALTIFLNYQSLSTAITSVFLPNVTERVTHNAPPKELSDMLIRIGRIQALLMFCVLSGFTVFGQQFIGLWLEKSYADAYWIVLFLIAPITIDLIQNIGITILQASNKLAFRSISFLVIAVVSILIAIPVAREFGAVGAALVTGIACLVSNIILNIYYKKEMKLEIGRYWKEVAPIILFSVVTGFGGVLLNQVPLPNSYFGLLIKIIIYVIIYALGLWFFIMNSYEKEIFGGIISKITRKFIKKSSFADRL
ncbi:lipopolysaccharide biosynthesis protein [Scatolibacter rhodanostii]|uniref:lipopolysaccharide biosynthesis protein n=1 Tax=Scatolibacter rhodanostii TaxID=2014781 RepID=UPI000C072FCC|nr:oligosaccharide flippase family protein [Scatolibacter rhodanostii]